MQPEPILGGKVNKDDILKRLEALKISTRELTQAEDSTWNKELAEEDLPYLLRDMIVFDLALEVLCGVGEQERERLANSYLDLLVKGYILGPHIRKISAELRLHF